MLVVALAAVLWWVGAVGATTTSAPAAGAATIPPYPFFEDPDIERFNHMTVHDYTERVYVGAVNRIYQLTPKDLLEENMAIMGPKDDSPKCPVTQVCPNEPKVPTNYYNKALVVDYSQSKLIACGSLFQVSILPTSDMSSYATVRGSTS